jgi:DNA polymerase-3 subunit delta
MKAEEVYKDIRNGQIAPVYFLQGEETFYIDLISKHLEDHLIPEGERSFNQTVVYGQDVSISDVLNHARRFPMMAERQLVLVKEAQQISDLNRENGEKQLLAYLKQPVPSTVLVFCHKHKKLDGRKALGKTIGKLSVLVTSDKLRDYQVPAWIESYVATRKCRIQPNALQLLTDSIGNDLERMANEISKILINYKDSVTIDMDMVQKHVGISKDYNVFELQKAIIRKDRLKAFQIIKYFAANTRKHPAIPVIAVLFAFFSRLLVAQQYRGAEKGKLASLMKVNPYAIQDYQEALRFYSLGEVIRNIHLLRAADLACKGVDSPATDDGEILKELVAKMLIS